MPTETMRFVAHDNLIVDVIKRQSGSLGKSTLEAVMNSIDAGAQSVRVTLGQEALIVEDDGKGFRTKEEIKEFFRVFGQPHAKEDGEIIDAKFGEFRMGRGQLFAFGVNTWETNEFVLRVDINTHGLNFHVDTSTKPFRGCRVTVELYERLSAGNVLQCGEEITKNCKYVDTPVFLNGKQINTPPQTAKWTEVTDDAYIRVREESNRGVDFYQQGVFVQTIPAYYLGGASGVIVTKRRVALNFARNEVMRSDKTFKRIMEKFKKDSEERVKAKRTLTEGERQSLLRQLAAGEIHWSHNLTAKIFADTTGRTWSINTLRRVPGSEQFMEQPDATIAFSFAPSRDKRADRAMQLGLGLVFCDELLDLFHKKPEKFFEGIDYSLRDAFSYVPLGKLFKADESKHRLVETAKETAQEMRQLDALRSVQWALCHECLRLKGEALERVRDYTRTLRVGIAQKDDAWTDGTSFIALNRDLLAKVGTSQAAFVALVNVMLHEMLHDDDNCEEGHHDTDFFKAYHDIQRADGGKTFGKICADAYTSYQRNVERLVKGASKKARQEQLKEEMHTRNEQLLSEVGK